MYEGVSGANEYKMFSSLKLAKDFIKFWTKAKLVPRSKVPLKYKLIYNL